jgi:3-deoxy-D-manno-octulosonic-acid transferase
MFKPRTFYTLGLWLLLPYIFFHLLWRARKQPEYLQHIGERFGRYAAGTGKPVIWLHTVSVGETRAAATLVQQLRERYPDHQILLTHTTPTGRATSEQLYGDGVLRVYLPYDYPFAVRRFLRHFRPRVGVLLETEIWFNLIHACHERQTPLLLLNARMSERSAQGYARWARLIRTGLHELHLVAAQTEDDALRLASLGNRAVPVMGNLKFDIEPPAALQELGKQLRDLFGAGRPVFLAASTREGEEDLLLDALQHSGSKDLLTVIVPRHPQRFDEVAALLERRGLRFQRRSAGRPVSPHTQVVLGDSMGEMFAYYVACDVAFIGGSLLPLGGQNLIEACAVGKPVLIGPHTFNFTQVTELAIECGAAIRGADAAALVREMDALLDDAARRERMGVAGLYFVSDNRGATDTAMSLIALALKHSLYHELISSQVESTP